MTPSLVVFTHSMSQLMQPAHQITYMSQDLPHQYLQSEIASIPSRVRLAVIGNPIAHSKSPQMQQAALDNIGIDTCYTRIQGGLEEQDWEKLMNELHAAAFKGLNVTIPFKKKAFQIAEERDALSELCQASNTLIATATGWRALNTDGPGFEQALRESFQIELADKRVLIMGACGGAGLALACQAALSGSPEITLVNRPRPELKELQAKLQACAPDIKISCCHFDSPEFRNAVQRAELIVNASSLGLNENDPMPFPADWLDASQFIYDILTHPTAFSKAAQKRGCRCATGESMLLWQGAYAFQHWFGIMPHIATMRQALKQA